MLNKKEFKQVMVLLMERIMYTQNFNRRGHDLEKIGDLFITRVTAHHGLGLEYCTEMANIPFSIISPITPEGKRVKRRPIQTSP
uniref:Uncharacterized protein n=1 Tax=Magallana gigas TaxID=29159 RepID=K1QVF1_MAGGI